MTTSADSGQIAKVREFWNEWVNGPDGGESLFLTSSNPSRTVFKFAAAFAASERQAVIEECCRAVCHHCRDASHSERYITKAKQIEGKWIHEEIGFESEGGGFDCYAAAIRSME